MVRWLEANGYDVKYIGRRRHRSARRRSWSARRSRKRSCRVGHDEYWSAGQRAQRRGGAQRRASTSRSSAATRCTGRRGASRASTASNTPYRTLVSYKDTLGGVEARSACRAVDRPARGATRASARPADGGRPGERADRHDLDGQLGHHGDHRARLDGEPALLAEHPRRRAHLRRRDARRPTRSATSGTRTSTTARVPPA